MSGIVDIANCSIEAFYGAVDLILNGPITISAELANDVPDTIVEKHDDRLPKEMRLILGTGHNILMLVVLGVVFLSCRDEVHTQ